jgi:NTE family protein
MSKQAKKTLSLALQGGGAHGAFTWGVLDRLIEEPNLNIDAISATSAGAMNAVMYTYGYLKGGRPKAKVMLEEFWKEVSGMANFLPSQSDFLEKIVGPFTGTAFIKKVDYWRHVFSLYNHNVFDINPLKDIVASFVDFDELRSLNNNKIKLFVNATNAKTGKIRIFDNNELSLHALMASACLPYLSQSITIEGEEYWEGAFSSNPSFSPLVHNDLCEDILLIQITPFTMEKIPTTIPEIVERINEISFSIILEKEIKGISIINKMIENNHLKNNTPYKFIRLHSMTNSDVLSSLPRISMLNCELDFLLHLKESGYKTADEWLKKNYNDINKKSTLDLCF